MESDNEIVVSHSSDVSGECVSVIDRENDGDSHCRSKRLDSDSAHKKASKSARIDVESGTWSCKYQKCIVKDDEDMLTYTKCKSKYHYRCTELPDYQISMFLSSGYRKYICSLCVDISEKMRKTMLETMDELSSDCTLTDKLQKELKNSKEVIRSTEKACDTLRKLASDKDEVIAQQKIIIDSCRCRSKDYNEELTNLRKKLEEANNLIDERNFELRDTKELLVEKKSEEVGANGNCKLEKELTKSLLLNEDLRNKLRIQVTITKKTELAFNTQTELVETKEELIKNQRIVIEHMKRAQEENTNLIDTTSNETEHPSVPGLHESVLCMTNLALHGVILNGFLVWADIQRRTTAEYIWNAEGKHFIKEEITDAKEVLWDVADNGVLGNMIKRQGPSKSTAEINDISNALKKLAEREVMPLFLGTSNMVMQTPSI